MKGLRERIEENDLKGFFENLLTGFLGSNTEAVIQLKDAYRLGTLHPGKRNTRDRDVLVRFVNWATKSLVLYILRDKPKLIEGQELTFYSDLCPLTLQKRREWKLISFSILYQWGFPLNVLIDYKGKVVVVKSFQQAKRFVTELDREEVDVQVLNPSPSENQHQENRRDSAVYRVGGDSVA